MFFSVKSLLFSSSINAGYFSTLSVIYLLGNKIYDDFIKETSRRRKQKKKHPRRNIVIYCFTFESFRFRTIQRFHKGFKAFTFFDKEKKTINQSLTRAIFFVHPSISYERKNNKNKTEKPIKRQQNKFVLVGCFSSHHCRYVLFGIVTKRFRVYLRVADVAQNIYQQVCVYIYI